MAGRAAGLVVANSGGGLGSTPIVTIRGSSVVNSDGSTSLASPILIIDGVMTTDINQMHRMNPKDIESFTILKDAEAVAIYGSQVVTGL